MKCPATGERRATAAADLHLRGQSVFLGSSGSTCGASKAQVLTIVNGGVAHSSQKVLKDHFHTQHILAEPDHPTSTDSGRSSKAKVLHFKHYANLHTTVRMQSVYTRTYVRTYIHTYAHQGEHCPTPHHHSTTSLHLNGLYRNNPVHTQNMITNSSASRLVVERGALRWAG